VFVAVGALGFVPALVPDGKLLGLFEVNAMHNLVHLVTGVIAILVGINGESASQMFFRIFGVIYALVAVLGLFYGEQPLLGTIANNQADVGLHAVIAVVALYLGFALRPAKPTTPVPG
jgi:Domain of unknown function (DUF4383)